MLFLYEFETDIDGAYAMWNWCIRKGEDCTEFLRLSAFRDALQDHRALCLLEDLTGRDAALAFVDRMQEGMIFSRYSHETGFMPSFREKLNEEILRNLS